MSDWISHIVMSPGADGDHGGRWTLTVTRTSGENSTWWSLTLDEDASEPGLKIYRSQPDGSCAMVVVEAHQPFEDAATHYGLDRAVFGSPTLWPEMHRDWCYTASGGVVENGWAWVHQSVDDEFPFTNQ
jgi:hypothetical protein